uniref:Uncharacterized protein n=1 Tax=Pavo cristatus TaxID=9049 RepID=A0A8C9EHP0_PAVCR
MEKFRKFGKFLKKRKRLFLPVPTFLLYEFCPFPTPCLSAHSYVLTHTLMSALCPLYFIMLSPSLTEQQGDGRPHCREGESLGFVLVVSARVLCALVVKAILLIGKLKGYSILAIAEELPDDGKIFACAEVPYLGVNSQEAFDYSSDGKKISMRVGPIADTLEALHAEDEHFDIVFIDADQRNAVNYYSFVMDNHLLRMDGVICVENTLMKGQVYLENISEQNVLAVRNLNTVINSDLRVEQVGAMQLVKLPVVLYLWILQSTRQNLSFVGAIIRGT